MTGQLADLLKFLSPDEMQELDSLLNMPTAIWTPLPGPQTMAYESEADIIGYGGSAGGGKTDLACGLSLTQHRRTAIFRQYGTELTAIIDRLAELMGGNRNGFNGKDLIWRFRRKDGVEAQIDLGSFPNLGDEKKQQGRPHDLLVFDEASNMREIQVRFLLGWLRSTVVGQRIRALFTFNPPTTAEGRWIIPFFGPWLDRQHPTPAKPGELRLFATINGEDVEIPGVDKRPFILGADGQRIYDFEQADYRPEDIIIPLTRTFIPARVSDNPYLLNTGYIAQLQALPEPLRSQMLYGDFVAGVKDDPWQVIPTEWVDAAMARWRPKSKIPEMLSMGVDVAIGGDDNFVVATRHAGSHEEGMWYAPLTATPGREVPNGPSGAAQIVAALRDGSPIHIDLFGQGAKVYGHLMSLRIASVYGIDVGEPTGEMDASGRMGFFNVRSKDIWRFRELLDPDNNNAVALPEDRELLQELCSYTWEPVVRNGISCIKVCGREKIVDRIGRSPDKATAVILARYDTPKRSLVDEFNHERGRVDFDPMARFEFSRQQRQYDPYR